MRIAAFASHPIQYFAPLWQEVSRRPGVELKVFYYSRHGLEASTDPGFGVRMAWDIDLLEGYTSEFLPRRWPTSDPLEYRWKGLNAGIAAAVAQGWDAIYVAGYVHLNNWIVLHHARRRGIPVLCQNDVSLITERSKPWALRSIKRLIVGSYFRRCSGLLATGDHSRDYFLHYGASPGQVAFVPYVVDTDRFRARAAEVTRAERREWLGRFGIRDGQRVVAFSGKLIPRKRPLDLVEALSTLNRPDVVGLFIGDGELRQQVQKVGGEGIRVTGFVNQREMPAVLSLADLLVLPSSYEAYGLVVGEAMALGIPCVVSDRCGCHGEHGVLRDGETGLLFRCGDVGDLAAKLKRLLDDPALLSALGRRARVVSDELSPRSAADNLLRVVSAHTQ